MTIRTWNGGTADWLTGANWASDTAQAGAPVSGDTAIIASGTVTLTASTSLNQIFDNTRVTLGGASGATLLLQDDQPIGRYFNVTVAGNATIEASGLRGFAGSITGTPNDGSTITLKADPGGTLVLLHGGTFNVTDRAIDFEGSVIIERDASIAGNIVNNGTLSIASGKTTLAGNDFTGTGVLAIGRNAELVLSCPVPVTQTISFAGTGGELALAYSNVDNFAGTITNFQPGDFIDFVGFGEVTSESLDTTSHTLTLHDDTGRSYVFDNVYGAAGDLTSTREANGHDLIGYASAAPQLDYQIDAGAQAMHADAVHQMTVPGTTTPITGAGIKIGIISTSYNLDGGAAGDIAAGYLPAAGVTVLQEGLAGNNDEGRAMAELIYQTAPGASLYFASTGNGIDNFATSVQALQAAGCNVIVDDISLVGSEPFFQLGDPAEEAISNAIAGGVTFVTSVGNYGNAYYQHAFATSQQTLLDGSVVQGMTFSNGTPYQSITALGGQFDQIDLQWDAPFYGTGGVATDQPDAVTFKVFDATTNALIGTSQQVTLNGHLVAESEFLLPYANANTDYRIAIYQTNGTQPVGEIKYLLSGISTGTGTGGRINDPDAGSGSGAVEGHQMVPGAIAAAATDVTNTAALGQSPNFTESFSSSGPGTLLFDAAGNRLATPIIVGSPDVTGPDAVNTSVPDFAPFFGTSAAAPNVAAVAALLLQVDPSLTPAALAQILADSAEPLSNAPTDIQGAGLVQADRAIALLESLACYRAGTLILTAQGARPIETLAAGDQIVTADGASRPIRWIGHRRVDCRRHPNPTAVMPIRIRAHAFGPAQPARDLFLSPDHAVFAAGVLIPAKHLVNGTTIAQYATEDVTYYHIELDSHDVILAEGLPCESYLDTGDRNAFAAGSVTELHPAWGSAARDVTIVMDALAYAPLRVSGPDVDRIRATLAARADERALAAAI